MNRISVKNCITVRSWIDPFELNDTQHEILAMLAQHPTLVMAEIELIKGGGYSACGVEGARFGQALNALVQHGYVERWLLAYDMGHYQAYMNGYKRTGDGPTSLALRDFINWEADNG